MLNFEQEIKKFHPSLELEDTEKVAKEENALEDFTDIMMQILESGKRKK